MRQESIQKLRKSIESMRSDAETSKELNDINKQKLRDLADVLESSTMFGFNSQLEKPLILLKEQLSSLDFVTKSHELFLENGSKKINEIN